MDLASMSFAKVYPAYLAKVTRKNRSKAELDRVICWLTGYDADGLASQIAGQADLRSFFGQAPQLNPNSDQITGTICGIRVEQIDDPLTRQVRMLDKLVDELAKGRAMDKILRGDPA